MNVYRYMYLLLIVVGVAVTSLVHAQERVTPTFTYQGRAFQSDGVTPLTGTATFQVELRSSDGTCLLYQETHSGIDLTSSVGFFALNIGSGTASSGLSFGSLFNNLDLAKTTLGGTCAGTYTPANQEARVLRVSVDVGGGPIQLDDQYIAAVPQALVADTLNGFTYNQFVQSLTTTERDNLANAVNGTVIYNITTGEFERYTGATWSDQIGATNLGASGASVFKQKTTGTDWFEFRKIIGGTGITVTENANDITITAASAAVTSDGTTIDGDGSAGDPLTVIESGLDLANLGGTLSHSQLATCSNGEILKYVAGAWACATDSAGSGTVTSVTAGDNTITIGGTAADPTVAVNEANLDLDAIGGTLGIDQLANCAANEILQQNASGTAWTCVSASTLDSDTTYSAGDGLDLTGTTFSIADDGVDADMIADGAIDALAKLGTMTCTTGQVLKINAGGTAWECAADADTTGLTTVSANAPLTGDGTSGSPLGVSVDGSTIIVNASDELEVGSIVSANITDETITTDDLSDMSCTGNQTIRRNAGNTAWECFTPSTGGSESTSVTSLGTGTDVFKQMTGTDIELHSIGAGSNKISIALDTDVIEIDVNEANLDLDAIGGTLGTDQLANCAADEILQQNVTGTAWTCVDASTLDTDTTYSAGDGLALNSTTFSIADDGVDADMIADGAIDALAKLGTMTCTTGQVLKINAGGTAWECASDTDTGLSTVSTDSTIDGDGTSGSPLSLADDAVTTDKIADDQVTAAKIADGAIDALAKLGTMTCTTGQVLKINAGGTAWECAADNAGSGSGIRVGGDTNSTMFIGDEAGSDPIDSGLLGVTATGVGALDSITTGDGNTAFGYNAATAVTTEWNVTAIGSSALKDNTASNNTAVGAFALQANTTGTGNVAVGSGALMSDTITTSNIAIGHDAMNSSDADYNIAIGTAALKNTSGGHNVAVGEYSSHANTSGSDNTAMGYHSLRSNESGLKNVAIGHEALYSVESGNYNVAIGDNAGRQANSGSSGNIFIGRNSGPTVAADYDDELYIDNTQTDTPLIHGDFSSDSLTINGDLNLSMTGKYFKYNPNNAACNDGQILEYDTGVSGWICGTAAAGGETNTAANVGDEGVGVYDAKDDAELQFRNIAALNNKVAVALDGKNITVGVTEANLDLDAIGGTLGIDQLANCASDEILMQNVTGTAWTCVDPSTLDTDTTYSAGAGLDLTGTTFSIPTDGVISSMIDDGTIATDDIGDDQITAAKIADGAIDNLAKLTAMGCSANQIIRRNAGNTAWECATASSGTTISGGTDNYLAMFNSAGDNVENSSVTDDGTDINILTGRALDIADKQIKFGNSLVMHAPSATSFYAGSSSGNTSTTAPHNTGVGYFSLNNITTGYQNTALGASALAYNTTGFYNVGIGRGALSGNSTDKMTGNSNVAVGASALADNTTGSNNIAVGYTALQYSKSAGNNVAIGRAAMQGNSTDFVTGSSNTAVGANSLASVTTGGSNAVLGESAMNSTTTGLQNVAIGKSALYYNTTGNYNTAVGSSSMYSDSTNKQTGNYNSAFGYQSLYDNTTGLSNVAIGSSALRYNTTGNYNVAVGENALVSDSTNKQTGNANTALGRRSLNQNTSGSNNTAVGFNALPSITSGGTNTAIGAGAGSNVRSSSEGNVLIGNSAGPPSPAIVNNQLYIDNSATSTPLIGGDFSANTLRFEGNVGIMGAASATYELDVNGDIEADAYYYSSDARRKENIYTLETSLDKILQLRGVSFNWIHSGQPEIGLIAQEVEAVYPDLVSTDAEGWKAVKYGNLVAPLIESTKELYGMCKMQEAQIQSIEARMAKTERNVASLAEENAALKSQVQDLNSRVQKLEALIEAISKKQSN